MKIIYFVTNGSAIKIGHTSDLKKRLASIATGSAAPLKIICTIEGTPRHERAIHHDLAAFRLNGEWFRDCEEVRRAIEAYRADGIEPRYPNKDRTVRRRQLNLEIELPFMDTFRLPMAVARSSYLKSACGSMEEILSEIKRRRSFGEDISDLKARADSIMEEAGMDRR